MLKLRLSWLATCFVVALCTFAVSLPECGVAAPSGGKKYGAPLSFEPPPVDLNGEAALDDESASPPPSAAEIAGQGASLQATNAAVKAFAGSGDSGGSSGGGDGAKSIRLFGTVEFRGPLKNLPKWERVLGAEQRGASFGAGRMPQDVAARWTALREKLKGVSLMEKAKAVNSFFNQWPYKTDMSLWGVEDYWATPGEFVRKSGDCEDYAIAKYYALRDLDVPASQLRVVALKDVIRNLGHAVLAVYIDGNAYILDNLSSMVLVHSRLTHYAPQFSANEEFRWAHIKPLSGPK